MLKKRDDGTLAPAEQAALVSLSDQIEEANASCPALVSELARLRGVLLPTLVRELGLPVAPRA